MRPSTDGPSSRARRWWVCPEREERRLQGTLVCALTDDDGRAALATAIALSERLDLRLVLAYVRDGIPARRLARLAAEHGVGDRAEQRSGTGDPATLIGRIAAEEGADLIVVGARTRGRLRRCLDGRLADQLGTETPVPVLIAPALTSG
jgi:nucleotide-binding universal stress UspA family protein